MIPGGIPCRRVLAAVLLCLLAMPAVALRQFTVRDGLGQNAVLALARDPQGFLWVATEDGLSRFDGHEFRTFRRGADTGLASSDIAALLEDGDALWLGSYGGGLIRLDLRSERFRSLDPGLLGSPFVLSLARDRDGALWVGTDGAGLARVEDAAGPTPRATAYRPGEGAAAALPGGRIWSLHAGPSGLWVATQYGLGFVPGGSRAFAPLSPPSDGPDPFRHNTEAIHEAPDGTLWIATWEAGLFRVDPSRRSSRQYLPGDGRGLPSRRVVALAPADDGALWIGTDAGLARWEPGCDCITGVALDLRQRDDAQGLFVGTLLADAGGGLWAGTFGEGLLRLAPGERAFLRVRRQAGRSDGLGQGRVRALLEDADGVLWVGSSGGGLQRVAADRPADGARWRFERVADSALADSARRPGIWSLHADRAGALWIGGEGWLDRLDVDRRRWRHWQPEPDGLAPGGVRALLEDRRGRLWVGATSGLGVLENDRPRRIRYSPDPAWTPQDHRVQALAEDPAGRIWVGSTGGLHVLDAEGAPLAHYREAGVAAGPPGGVIYAVRFGPAGKVWVAGNAGLCVSPWREALDALTWRCLGEADGLAQAVIYGLLEDAAGGLWLAMAGGLARVDGASEAVTLQLEGDELDSEEFAPNARARGRGGMLYFGGSGGLVAFDPSRLATSTAAPPVRLTGVDLANVPLRPGQRLADGRVPLPLAPGWTTQLELRHTDRLFGFRLSALDFDRPGSLIYAYRLDGFDEDWVVAGTRPSASYTNVPPGRYALRARVRDGRGQWGEPAHILDLEITPPFWARSEFRAAVSIAALLLLWLAYRLRIRGLAARQRLLEAEVASRTAELAAQTARHRQTAAALEEANAQLFELSTRDALTGVYNRRHALEVAEAQLEAAQRDGRAYACALIDVDHFKQVNDGYGHLVGDAVLRDFAGTVRAAAREGDLVGRYGGEEFVVFLREADAAAATAWAETLRARLAARRIGPRGREIAVTASIGVAVFGRQERLDDGIARADAALYRAKAGGRDRVATAADV